MPSKTCLFVLDCGKWSTLSILSLHPEAIMSTKKQVGQMQRCDEVKVEIETNPKSIASDPYSCAIKTKHDYFVGWKTVGLIPCEISR